MRLPGFFARKRQAQAKRERDSAAQASQQSVLLQAWMGQRTEWTKFVFAMSSSAVGLIAVALLNKSAVELLPLTKVLLFIGGIAFACGAVTCLSALKKSADALELVMSNRPLDALDKELMRLESWQHHSFVYGVCLLLLSAFFQHVLQA